MTREEAVSQSEDYVREKTAPRFPELSDEQRRTAERLATINPNASLSYYISSRLPVDLRERMQALGDSADTLAILEFAADAGISEIAEEAGACVFWWNHPQADEKFFSWAAQESAGRVYTFPLLEHLWKTYNVISAAERLKAEPQPTPEELDQLSDEQVDSLLTRTRILRSEKSRLNEIDRRQSTCGLGP